MLDKIFIVIAVVVLAVVFATFAIMLGWKLFMVPVVGVPMITFGQAFGLSLLANAIFKSHISSN